MGRDTANSIVTAGPIRNASIYFQSPEYVAEQVFPVLQVTSPNMKITKYLPGDFFRNDAEMRGEGGQARRGGFKTTTVNYSAIEYAFCSPVTDEMRRNAKLMNAMPLQPDVEAVELSKRKIMMKQENKVSSLITAGTWADGNASGLDAEGTWASDAGTNTFVSDVALGVKTLREKGIVKGGNIELRLVIDDLTFDQVVEISRVRDQIKYTSSESVTPDLLAKVLKIDKVIVASSVYNSSKETKGGLDFTAARFWEINSGKGMAFLYAYPKSMGLKVMTAGVLVNQQFDVSEGGGYERVSRWREDAHHQDVYEVAKIIDEVQVCADAGYLWKDTIQT